MGRKKRKREGEIWHIYSNDIKSSWKQQRRTTTKILQIFPLNWSALIENMDKGTFQCRQNDGYTHIMSASSFMIIVKVEQAHSFHVDFSGGRKLHKAYSDFFYLVYIRSYSHRRNCVNKITIFFTLLLYARKVIACGIHARLH